MAKAPARTATSVAAPVSPGQAAGAAWGNVARLTDTDSCSACGLCAELCPRAAIELTPLPEIAADLCTGCGECADACPGGALALTAT